MAKTALTLLALLSLAIPAHGDCRHFFVKRQVVVQQVAVPVFVQPPVYYAAGQDLQAEALAEKVARLVEQKLSVRQQNHQQPPLVKPGTFAKCASCHAGANPAGGLVLDGETPIDCRAYFRWGQIAGQGKDVPERMQALIQSMTPDQKGAINDAMLNLVERGQPADKPPPPVDGELR